MIVVVTLDPAVHVSYETQRIVPGQSHPVGRVSYRAGGRGPAVARMLHTFGHEVVAAGLTGGTAGELIKAELSRVGVPTQFTPIAMESRRVVEVTDTSTGTTTSFAEPSPYITTEELGRLAADYRALIEGASGAVLCGGVPDALPPETFATFATYAAEAGVPVVLDAGGSALAHGAARRPALVIPEDSAGEDRTDPAALMAAGVGAVVTMSGSAVTVLTGEQEWRARLDGSLSAQAEAGLGGADPAGADPAGADPAGADPAGADPAGAGAGGAGDGPASAGQRMSRDALVAGFVPGVTLGWSWPDSLRHAVSLAATASLAGRVDLVTYERLLPEVRVEPGPGRPGPG